MSISKEYKDNFETLSRAFKAGDVALLECVDRKTKKKVIALVAMGRDGDMFTMAPLAKMFDGNPYEELDPPS